MNTVAATGCKSHLEKHSERLRSLRYGGCRLSMERPSQMAKAIAEGPTAMQKQTPPTAIGKLEGHCDCIFAVLQIAVVCDGLTLKGLYNFWPYFLNRQAQ